MTRDLGESRFSYGFRSFRHRNAGDCFHTCLDKVHFMSVLCCTVNEIHPRRNAEWIDGSMNAVPEVYLASSVEHSPPSEANKSLS
jgi:hypothetical protein